MKIQLLKNILKGILQTCLHSHLNKLLISRPTVSRYRNDNVRPVKSFKPLSLSLSPLISRTQIERKDSAQLERRNLRGPEREREVHKSNRSWRFMARYG